MALNRLTASIGGTTYTFVSEDSVSYMRDLAAKVDAEITAVLENDRTMSTTMAAVLAAVQNADIACKESRAANDLRVKLKTLVDERETLEGALAAAKAEVRRLQEENVSLRNVAPPTKASAPAKKEIAWPLSSFEEILDDTEDV